MSIGDASIDIWAVAIPTDLVSKSYSYRSTLQKDHWTRAQKLDRSSVCICMALQKDHWTTALESLSTTSMILHKVKSLLSGTVYVFLAIPVLSLPLFTATGQLSSDFQNIKRVGWLLPIGEDSRVRGIFLNCGNPMGIFFRHVDESLIYTLPLFCSSARQSNTQRQ